MTERVEGQGDTPEELMQEVRSLVEQVRLLNTRLTKQYPNREEVKRQGRRRALQTLAFGVILIIVANIFTIITVSYCFLNVNPGARPAGCGAVPGYSKALDDNDARLARFQLLISQIDKNREEIKLLRTENRIQERRLKRLESGQSPE